LIATVTIAPEAQLQFQGLPVVIQTRVEKILARLEQWPAVSGAKPLSGNLAGHFRIRTGDYRIQFRVEGGPSVATPVAVIVEKVGHRDRFYED
jgi:mRNA-degrading endonuclease RelE of RelBE toxin-antitoxin system